MRQAFPTHAVPTLPSERLSRMRPWAQRNILYREACELKQAIASDWDRQFDALSGGTDFSENAFRTSPGFCSVPGELARESSLEQSWADSAESLRQTCRSSLHPLGTKSLPMSPAWPSPFAPHAPYSHRPSPCRTQPCQSLPNQQRRRRYGNESPDDRATSLAQRVGSDMVVPNEEMSLRTSKTHPSENPAATALARLEGGFASSCRAHARRMPSEYRAEASMDVWLAAVRPEQAGRSEHDSGSRHPTSLPTTKTSAPFVQRPSFSAAASDSDKVAISLESPLDLTFKEQTAMDAEVEALLTQYNFSRSETKVVLRFFRNVDREGNGYLDPVLAETVLRTALGRLYPGCRQQLKGLPSQAKVYPSDLLEWLANHAFDEDVLVPLEQMHLREMARLWDMCYLEVERLQKQFAKFNTSGSGLILYDEFRPLLHQLLKIPTGIAFLESRVKFFWKEVDRDASGEVTFDEFVTWYRRYFGRGGGGTENLSSYMS